MASESETIQSIVCGYISHCLQKIGYSWTPNFQLRNTPKVTQYLKTVCQEFKSMFSEQFLGLADRLALTPAVAEHTFIGVTNELFSEGITWPRIICLFVFSGELALHFVENDWTDMLDDLSIWMTSFIERYLQPWIRDHGGWDGLVVFAKSRKNGCNYNSNGIWPNLKMLMCTVAAAGMIGLTFVGALSSKT